MILVLVVAERSIRNVMELTPDLINILKSLVLDPSLNGAFAIFVIALINEITGIFPIGLAIAAPLLFLNSAVTPLFYMQLLVFVSLPFALGNTISSLLVYWLAYAGGKPAIDKWGRFLRFSWDDVESVKKKLHGSWYDDGIFLILRSIPFLTSLPINIAAGIVRMRLINYIVITFLGTVIKMMITLGLVLYGVLGYSHFAQFYL